MEWYQGFMVEGVRVRVRHRRQLSCGDKKNHILSRELRMEGASKNEPWVKQSKRSNPGGSRAERKKQVAEYG